MTVSSFSDLIPFYGSIVVGSGSGFGIVGRAAVGLVRFGEE